MGDPAPREKDLRRLHLWQIQGVRDILVVSAVLALLWIGYAMRAVTVPVLVAFGLAYLVEPLVERMTARGRMRRSMAVTVILVVAGVATVLATTLAVPVVWGQTNALMEELRTTRFQQLLREAERALPAEWGEPVGRLADWLTEASASEPVAGRSGSTPAVSGARESSEASGASSAAPSAETISAADERLRDMLRGAGAPPGAESPEDSNEALLRRIVAEQVELELARRGLMASTTTAPTTPDVPFASLFGAGTKQVLARAIDAMTLLFLAFLVPFYFYFFSVSYPEAIRWLKEMLPEGRRDRILHLAREMDRAVSGFVRGRIVIAFIMGVMAAVGWKIFGVPYAITLGLAAGVLSIVPYLGFAAVPVASGMLLLDQVAMPPELRMAWYWILGGPLLVFVIVQSIEGYLLTPVIAGKVTDLGPVSIFVAVLAGASIAGVYGMLLSIPAAACLKIWWREVLLPRIREWSAGRRADPLPLDSD